MAEKLLITGTPAKAKIRNPLGVVGLTLITFGIYYFFWFYFGGKRYDTREFTPI